MPSPSPRPIAIAAVDAIGCRIQDRCGPPRNHGVRGSVAAYVLALAHSCSFVSASLPCPAALFNSEELAKESKTRKSWQRSPRLGRAGTGVQDSEEQARSPRLGRAGTGVQDSEELAKESKTRKSSARSNSGRYGQDRRTGRAVPEADQGMSGSIRPSDQGEGRKRSRVKVGDLSGHGRLDTPQRRRGREKAFKGKRGQPFRACQARNAPATAAFRACFEPLFWSTNCRSTN